MTRSESRAGMAANRTPFFVAGGTLPGTVTSYVDRQADTTLLSALEAGEFCYVLDTRQVGKSSLMVRTAERLRAKGRRTAILDISSIGEHLTMAQWYYGMLSRIAVQLGREEAAEAFWVSQTSLGVAQRWFAALQSVIVRKLDGPLVVFVDEIDSVRKLSFCVDEFFAQIRAVHSSRAYETSPPDVIFCLMGVATPSDLIQDVRTTPFNIGRRIAISDFAPAELQVLANGLSGTAKERAAQLKRVWRWTAGHPYLTQKLCQAIVETGDVRNGADVDAVC